jgi:hypothetical protein
MNMKNTYKSIAQAPLLLALLISCHNGKVNKELEKISELPKFKIRFLDSSILDSQKIPDGKVCVLFYFDPECEHCQHETKNIISHKNELKNVLFYLVTNADPSLVSKYCKANKLDEISNFFIGTDYNFSFYKVFVPRSVPYFAIYNSDKRLVEVNYGGLDMKSLIDKIII